MRKPIVCPAFCLSVLVAVVSMSASLAHAQGCSVEQMTSNRNQMLRLATKCRVSGELLNSITKGFEANTPSPSECRARRPVNSQRSGFDECAVVYLCAAQAYNHAIKLTLEGTNCEQARMMGLQKYPVQ